MKIIHLVRDEKFILFFDNVFSGLAGVENRYIVKGEKGVQFKHIGTLDIWRVVNKKYFLSPLMEEDLKWATCLIVHYMDVDGARMIMASSQFLTTVWSGWGRDYYCYMPGGEKILIGKDTARLMKLKESNRESWLRHMAHLLKYWLRLRLIKSAAYKVDYFSAPIENDYFSLKQAIGNRFKANYIQLNYISVEQTFMSGARDGNMELGEDILVGNSSTPLNNHVEAFNLLAQHELGKRKVIVPLSYGSKNYRTAVIREGKRILGERFYPIVEFMRLEEYNRLIFQCSIVLMNNRRQMAIGNIGTMLYWGAKIFLDQVNPTYNFFRENGAHVYSMNRFWDGNDGLFEPLSAGQANKNRAVLESLWSHDVVVRNAHSFVDKIKLLHK